MKSFLVAVWMLVVTSAVAVANDNMGANGFYISKDLTTYQAGDVSSLLKQMTLESPDKNILFYIHGRSQTLEKEWNNINTVEQLYNVRVLMLHWESWNYMLGRPVKNALEASKQLALGLDQISKFKKDGQLFFQDHKMFIMFHSMGNIVLKNYIEKYKTIQDSTLFDSAILTGADVPFTGHKKWVSEVNFAHDIYVVANNNDSVLLASVAHDYIDPSMGTKNDDRLGLGKGLDNVLFLNLRLSQKALYFDITKLAGAGHRHYLSSVQGIEDLFHFMFKEQFDQIPLSYKAKDNYYRF